MTIAIKCWMYTFVKGLNTLFITSFQQYNIIKCAFFCVVYVNIQINVHVLYSKKTTWSLLGFKCIKLFWKHIFLCVKVGILGNKNIGRFKKILINTIQDKVNKLNLQTTGKHHIII